MTWVGDHPPRHVPVYRDGRLVVKWDLGRGQAMQGVAPGRVRRLLAELVAEGLL